MTPPRCYTQTEVDAILEKTLAWSEARDFLGHNKHDGLNSPLLGLVCGWSYLTRLIGIQAVMRAPVNLRSLLGVPPTANPKGLALFARAYMDRYALTKDPADRERAVALLERLLTSANREFPGLSWGYPYPWQDVGFMADRDFPNRVVTSFVGKAFLQAQEELEGVDYRGVLDGVVTFLVESPRRLVDEPGQLCVSYVPSDAVTWIVMDVSVLAGAVVARAARILERDDWCDTADRLVRYVVSRQTEEGAWFYTDPPGDSHISHDNYHTGFILDAILDHHQATGSEEFLEAYDRGLEFYAHRLFTEEGAPRWMHDVDFPHDIHGSAQGLLTFSRCRTRTRDHDELLARILGWALGNMYDPEGRFYYQRRRFSTRRFTLMRWCNGWMTHALATWRRYSSATSGR